MKSASHLRHRIVATALVVSSAALAFSANAAIGAGGGIPSAQQITNLANQCRALAAVKAPLTVTAPLENLALVVKDTRITVTGECDNVPVLGSDGLPSNKFILTFSRHIGSETGPLVGDQITYAPPSGDGAASVQVSLAGQCESETRNAMEARAIAAGVDVGPLRARYIKVASDNCTAIRNAIAACIADKGGEGC